MQRAALTAAAIASSGAKVRAAAIKPVQPGRQVYMMTSPFADAPLGDRITLVKEAYQAAKGHDPRITKVVANLADSLQCVTIVNSDGLMVSDARPQVRLRRVRDRRGRRQARLRPGQRGGPRRDGLLPDRGHDPEGDRRAGGQGGDHPARGRGPGAGRVAGGAGQLQLGRHGPRGRGAPARGRRQLAEDLDHVGQAGPDGGATRASPSTTTPPSPTTAAASTSTTRARPPARSC